MSDKRSLLLATLLLAILLLTGLVYLPGLNGPFLLDDTSNLYPVQQWLSGETGWRNVVFGNESGLFGRPVSMASFVAGAAILDATPFSFKLVNLLIHLASGALLFVWLSRLERLDTQFNGRPPVGAMIVTAIWLLHPMQVSTVLYSVQRMAMLSALFMIATLLVYTTGRQQLELGKTRLARLFLFVGVPVFTALAVLSKENGLLAPWLCLVLEWALFRPRSDGRRPAQVRAFALLFGVLPLAVASAVLIARPDLVLADFANRPFTLAERLLTQGRVLWDYVFGTVLPNGSRYSLYRDGYTVSTGLFTPVSTLFAWLGWLGLAGLAVLLRRRVPGFAMGIGFFFVGHAMESSILPLLVYFEHRNYLPSIGILWALASMIRALVPLIEPHLSTPKRLMFGASILIVLALAAATFNRAALWQSYELILTQSVERYPDSRHARMALAELEMNRLIPDLEKASAHYRHLQSLQRPTTRMIGTAGLLVAQCHTNAKVNPELTYELFNEIPEAIEADFLRSASAIRNVLENGECEGVRLDTVADALVEMLDRAALPETARPVWQMRFEAARMYHSASDNFAARTQARQAWEAGGDINVGLFLMGLEISTGATRSARELAEVLETRIPEGDSAARSLLNTYRSMLPLIDLS